MEEPRIATDVKYRWSDYAVCFDCPCGETEIILSEPGEKFECECGRIYMLDAYLTVADKEESK